MNRSRTPRSTAVVLAAVALTVGCASAAGSAPHAGSAGHGADRGRRGRPHRRRDLRGRATADHVVFEGIPYAAAPVGELRWQEPRPAEAWDGVREATRPGPVCPQTYTYPPGSPPTSTGAEDCLSLNVHVPRGVDGPLPVLVFLHGGGFTGGGGAGYDPRRVSGRGCGGCAAASRPSAGTPPT